MPHHDLMPRVTFRDASLDITTRTSQIDDTRLMDAVPPIGAQVWFSRRVYDRNPRKGRVVDQIWSLAYDNPNDVIVDVILALD